jgi:hypothetical protein
MVVQQLSYKLNQVTKSDDNRLGSDPRLYVAMVHVEFLLRDCAGWLAGSLDRKLAG